MDIFQTEATVSGSPELILEVLNQTLLNMGCFNVQLVPQVTSLTADVIVKREHESWPTSVVATCMPVGQCTRILLGICGPDFNSAEEQGRSIMSNLFSKLGKPDSVEAVS